MQRHMMMGRKKRRQHTDQRSKFWKDQSNLTKKLRRRRQQRPMTNYQNVLLHVLNQNIQKVKNSTTSDPKRGKRKMHYVAIRNHGAAVTRTELNHSFYMHGASAHFMLVRVTCALVYLCVSLPATQCIGVHDFSCSVQKRRNAVLRDDATWKKTNITDALSIKKIGRKTSRITPNKCPYFLSLKSRVSALGGHCPYPG